MPLQIDSFLLILRILFVILLYLFLMQVVIAISRDLRKTAANTGGPSNASKVAGHLIVVDSGPSSIPPGTSFELEPQTYIGRGPTNTLQLPEGFISTEHTRMTYRNGVWYVQDAGSVNGTFVNNQPARDPIIARPGDIIRIGYIQFKLTQ